MLNGSWDIGWDEQTNKQTDRQMRRPQIILFPVGDNIGHSFVNGTQSYILIDISTDFLELRRQYFILHWVANLRYIFLVLYSHLPWFKTTNYPFKNSHIYMILHTKYIYLYKHH